MPLYEVRVDIEGSAWITLAADDSSTAEEWARNSFILSDLQYWQIQDCDITEIPAETAAPS